MVGLVADNAKLRQRSAAMVADIAGVPAEGAAAALATAGGAVKAAVLIALGATPDAATALLTKTNGILRAALAQWEASGRAKTGERQPQQGD
jgi:N-acetylmuramic acid 6-phosphate etherase